MKTVIKQATDWSNQNYHVEIIPNQSIKIDCLYSNHVNPRETSVSYKIGERAEYGSYNTSFLGTIISITENTVTINTGSRENRRLKLADFCLRNWDGIEKKIEEIQNYMD